MPLRDGKLVSAGCHDSVFKFIGEKPVSHWSHDRPSRYSEAPLRRPGPPSESQACPTVADSDPGIQVAALHWQQQPVPLCV